MPPTNNITITIVVNGVPTPVTVNVQQKVKQLVHEALRESGQPDQSPGNWELKTEAGATINQDQRIADAGIAAGVTLFLSLLAGGGG